MTPEQIHTICDLREEGYAVTIFTPEELQGVSSSTVSDIMCERGWDTIDDLKGSVTI